MKKINLMILSWLFPPSTGGLESYTHNLAKHLSKKCKVVVFTTGREYKDEGKEKFKIYRLKEMYPYKQKQEDYRILDEKLRRVLIEEKINLVHSHNLICLPTKFSSIIIKAIKDLKIPLIDHCHDARYKNLNPNIAKKYFHKIIAVSNFVKKRLIEIGIEKRKIVVIGNSIDTSLFNPNKYNKAKARKYFNLPINKKIIVFPSRAIRTSTGKFGRQKGFLILFSAIKKIKRFRDDFCVVFPINVGLRENKKERDKVIFLLRKKIRKFRLENNIKWIERRINFIEMPILYKASDIMCTPSVSEAFGLVFLESMAMGIPPIGARSGATPELIKNGKNGFLIEPGDSKNLAKIIIKLIKYDKLRQKIGENAIKFVEANFSFVEMIKKIKGIYYKSLK